MTSSGGQRKSASTASLFDRNSQLALQQIMGSTGAMGDENGIMLDLAGGMGPPGPGHFMGLDRGHMGIGG